MLAHRQDLTRHVGRVVAGQEDDHVGDLEGLGGSPEGLAGRQLLEEPCGRHLLEVLVHGEAGSHRVDAHAGLGSFDRCTAREGHDAGLGRCVVGLARLRAPAEHGGVVDDRAAPPLDHVRKHRSGHAEGARQRDVEHTQPGLVAEIRHLAEAPEARVVHQHIQMPHLVEAASHERLYVALPRHVAELTGRRLPRDGFDLLGSLAQPPLVEIGEHHARSLFRTASRGGEADPGPGRGRDQHRTALEELAAGGIGRDGRHRHGESRIRRAKGKRRQARAARRRAQASQQRSAKPTARSRAKLWCGEPSARSRTHN
jgi:hypothetical protein